MAKKRSATATQTLPGMESVPGMPDGYYSGDKPNPQLRHFIEEHGKPFNPDDDDYAVRPFDQPINTTKSAALYNMHTYWSKKPFNAIQQYIRHYTEAGDVVLDPFCGCGSTGLAALLEGRKAVCIDRSPAATFISAGYCTPIAISDLQAAFNTVTRKAASELEWLYATKCDRCGGDATTTSTIYSLVLQCPRCLKKVPLHDCHEVEKPTRTGKLKRIAACPHCFSQGRTEEIALDAPSFGRQPVEVHYLCTSGCIPARGKRAHNSSSAKKRKCFEQCDLGKLKEIERKEMPFTIPNARMMHAFPDQERWGLLWRPYLRGIDTVANFFTKRNLWAVACLLTHIDSLDDKGRLQLRFTFSSMVLFVTIMHQHNKNTGGNISKGTYYVPPVFKDMNVWQSFERKYKAVKKGYSSLTIADTDLLLSTQSATDLSDIPSNSIDFIFTDPPYSWKVQFGEVNFMWEVLLSLDSHWHSEEIIVNDVRGVSEQHWVEKMRKALGECFRVLKPGRWMSLCYHDTSEGTWGSLQDVLAECGFLPDSSDTPLFIETAQKTWKQLVADKVTKRDLVLNVRKPGIGDWIMTHLFIPPDADASTFQDMGRQIIREHLTAHPGSPKDRIYDELVSRMVSRGEMEAHDFDALLRSVAEQVQERVKETPFDNKKPDLIGSHVVSRWYLKETADQIDQAEQDKEDASAEHLENFMAPYLDENPEQEGVHYSDLFEQVITIPAHERPRRLFENWLPEYFFKTPDGTWRPPEDEKERQQKAALREAGTLRRMKRFANTLIEGVPVRDQDRPENDRTLAEWIRQCRRAGLYEQGQALYLKGDLNLDNLSEEEQIEVEDDYGICVKRGGDGKKKKRKGRKKT